MRYGHHHDHDYDDDYDDVRITHYYSYDYQAPPTPVYQMPPVSEPTYQPPVSTTPLPSTQATAPYCREFTRRVVIGGVEQEAYGTACQQEDGSWKMISR